MHGIETPTIQKRVRSYDGTEIAYYLAGTGPEPLVMAPGLGTPFITWKYLARDLDEKYTLVTWDPRGTYDSAIPADPQRLLLEDHVRDMVAVCEAENLTRFAMGGWSMGVQICLEYTHQFPQHPTGLILIGGTYQHVLSTAFAVPGAHETFRSLLRLARTLSPAVGFVASRALRSPGFIEVLGALGMVANNRPHFARMAHQFSDTDWRTFLNLILLLDRHSAADYLPRIRVPTLVIAGNRDMLTPLSVLRRMHRLIPDSRIFEVNQGTHYLVVEYPEIVNVRIKKFLRSLDGVTRS